jgi:hypothetical protein
MAANEHGEMAQYSENINVSSIWRKRNGEING